MKIHEIVHDTALEIVANAVDDNLLSDVDKLNICKIFLGNRFVNLLVVADSIHEVLRRVFRILTLIVGAGGLDFQDVGSNQLLVITLRLDKHNLEVVGLA